MLGFFQKTSLLIILSMYIISIDPKERGFFLKSIERTNLYQTLDTILDTWKINDSPFSQLSIIIFSPKDEIPSNVQQSITQYLRNYNLANYRTKIYDSTVSQKIWPNSLKLTNVLLIEDERGLNLFKAMAQEQQHQFWTARHRYLIVYNGNNTSTIHWNGILGRLWTKYNVHRVVVTTYKDNYKSILVYRPLEKSGNNNEYGQVYRFYLKDTLSFLPAENFNDLRGYPIRVTVFPSLLMNIKSPHKSSTYKFSGLDGDVMMTLKDVLNANFHIKVINATSTVNSGDQGRDAFQKALKGIEIGDTDIVLTGFFAKTYTEYQYYQFTTAIYEDKLCFVTPAAGFVPKAYMPLLPFEKTIWIYLGVYNIFISVIWIFFQRQIYKVKKSSRIIEEEKLNFDHRVLGFFKLILMACLPLKSPRSPVTVHQRIFLLGSLIFVLIIGGLYQSCLVSSLSKPWRYRDFQTLEDVANSNLSIVTKYRNIFGDMFTENTWLANRLRPRMRHVDTNESTIEIVAQKKNVVALGRLSSLKLNTENVYYDENGQELVHVVEECPASYHLSYVVRLHSPYLDRIDMILMRMRQSGLISFWNKNMMYAVKVTQQKNRIVTSNEKVRLTLNHYSLTFLGLFFGLVGSTLVFCGELFFNAQ